MQSSTANITKISETLASPIEKLFKAGGLALVFIFVGLLFSVYAFIYQQGKLAIPIFIVGSVLILISFVLFIITQYQGPIKTRKALKKSAETLDTLQETSIELVRLTSLAQSYSYKHIDKIKKTVDAALPLIKPFLGERGKGFVFEIEKLNAGIVDFSSKAEEVIRNVEKALVDSDFSVLKKYETDITGLNEQMKNALKTE